MLAFLLTIFIHNAQAAERNLHLQATAITQDHGPFASDYEGKNSLKPTSESKTSLTLTVFAGTTLWRGAEFYIDPELTGGEGFSETHGIAGFTNGEIYRVGDPSPHWNLARAYVKQTFGFGGEQEELKDQQQQLAAKVDVDRLTVVAGRFSLSDFFDVNTYSHDPRTQFMNWSFMDNGAWDYAADTRGYTWGVYIEYNRKNWSLRAASVAVPKEANGVQFDENFPFHRGDNAEFEWRYKTGTVRLLAFHNVANMGSYQDAIATSSDVSNSRMTREKFGAGLSVEQSFMKDLAGFARLGWSDGKNETWAFTEIDRTLTIGSSLAGALWSREKDHAGVAIGANLLSDLHRDYLAGGGYGFMIGDGKLNYGAEEILEAYYLFHVQEGLDLTGDYQFLVHPAYNTDRGPASVFSLRLHYEI